MYPILFNLPVGVIRDYWVILIIIGVVLFIGGFLFAFLEKRKIDALKKEGKSKSKLLFYIFLSLFYIGIIVNLVTVFSIFITDKDGEPLEIFQVPSYTTFITLGFLTVIITTYLKSKVMGVSSGIVLTVCTVGVVLAFVGGKLSYIIFDTFNNVSTIRSWGDFFSNLYHKFFYDNGMMSFGAFVISIPFAIIYLKAKKQNIKRLFDGASPSIILGLGIAKIGCICAGCCFGKICDKNPIAMNVNLFDENSPIFKHYLVQMFIADDIYVWPAQIIESLTYIILAVVLEILFRKLTLKNKAPFDGFIFSMFLMLYGGSRFLIEFIRVNPPREWLFGLTDGQSTALLLAFGGLIILIYHLIFKGRKPLQQKPENITYT